MLQRTLPTGFIGAVSPNQNPTKSGRTPPIGRSPDWLKMKNADAPAVKREEEEEWGK
jgi:hypothetical protein